MYVGFVAGRGVSIVGIGEAPPYRWLIGDVELNSSIVFRRRATNDYLVAVIRVRV